MLIVDRLFVATSSGRPILQDITFTVADQQSIGLVGESGSGKSMTAKTILGLLPRELRVTSGSITLDDVELLSITPRAMARIRGCDIGYVPQDPFASLNPVLRIGEQIPEIGRLHQPRRKALANTREILRGYRPGRIPRREREDAQRMLESVQIRDAATAIDQFPHNYSGGMRQRAVIASATALSPRLLIADEPTTALDASVETAVLSLMEDKRRASLSSLLFVSHDLDVISRMCDSIVVMYRGRIVESGATGEVLRAPKHPYTRMLAASSRALRRRDIDNDVLLRARSDFAEFRANSGDEEWNER